jgi:hypothetical protein
MYVTMVEIDRRSHTMPCQLQKQASVPVLSVRLKTYLPKLHLSRGMHASSQKPQAVGNPAARHHHMLLHS